MVLRNSSSRSPGPYCHTLNTGVVGGSWVVDRDFESHVHHENNVEFSHVNNLVKHSPWVPMDCEELRTHTKTKAPAVRGGGGGGMVFLVYFG